MMVSNIYKFLLDNTPIIDIKRLCEENGYCLVIYDNKNYKLTKEHMEDEVSIQN